MNVSAWYGGSKKSRTFGIRVGMKNRETYFDRTWNEIVVDLDSKSYTIKLTPGFWGKCPEFRDRGEPVIRKWLQKNKTLIWQCGNPPKATLQPLGRNRFRLLS